MDTLETIAIVFAVYILVFIAHRASRGVEQIATQEGGADGDGRGLTDNVVVR